MVSETSAQQDFGNKSREMNQNSLLEYSLPPTTHNVCTHGASPS